MMIMKRSTITGLSFWCLVAVFFVALVCGQELEGGCRAAQRSESNNGNDTPSNRLDELGGLRNIDKITKVNVKWGIFTCILGLGAEVVTQMTVTYRFKDQKTKDITFGGDGGCRRGEFTVALAEDEYITAIDNSEGDYMDFITLYTNKNTYGPYGGGSNTASRSPKYKKARSVIKAFKWYAGAVVDRLGVYWETDRVLKRIADSPVTIQPKDDDSVLMMEPMQVDEADNRDGVTILKNIFAFESKETRTDRVTLSSSSVLDVGLTVTAGFNVKGISASREFSVGYAVENSISEEEVFAEEETFSLTREYDVPPGFLVRAYFSYSKVEYTYTFSGPVKCVYTFDPDTEEDGGGTIDGIIAGSLGFQQTKKIRIETVRPPTEYPTRSPTTSPSPTVVLLPEQQTPGPTRTLAPVERPSDNIFGKTQVPSALSISEYPSQAPSLAPTVSASPSQSLLPSEAPSNSMSPSQSLLPSVIPSISVSPSHSSFPSKSPSSSSTPIDLPSQKPSLLPSKSPSGMPSSAPTKSLTLEPTITPTRRPALTPTFGPTIQATKFLTAAPSAASESREAPGGNNSTSAPSSGRPSHRGMMIGLVLLTVGMSYELLFLW